MFAFSFSSDFTELLCFPMVWSESSTLKLKKKLNSSTFKVEDFPNVLLKPIANEENRVAQKVE